jgi:hypothetical protein
MFLVFISNVMGILTDLFFGCIYLVMMVSLYRFPYYKKDSDTAILFDAIMVMLGLMLFLWWAYPDFRVAIG